MLSGLISRIFDNTAVYTFDRATTMDGQSDSVFCIWPEQLDWSLFQLLANNLLTVLYSPINVVHVAYVSYFKTNILYIYGHMLYVS